MLKLNVFLFIYFTAGLVCVILAFIGKFTPALIWLGLTAIIYFAAIPYITRNIGKAENHKIEPIECKDEVFISFNVTKEDLESAQPDFKGKYTDGI